MTGTVAGLVVVGVDVDGRTRFRSRLGHGQDPRRLAFDHGCPVVRPLEARRDPSGVLTLTFLVQPHAGGSHPQQPVPARDPGLQVDESTRVEVRQRAAAYALVTSERGLLATEFSDRTGAPGRWGLPGGGIEENEQPGQAVLREVAEETAQTVEVHDLVEVQSSHWVGRSPRGTVEDFHAVRLIYTATCAEPSGPMVLDVGGTTESARWVPLAEWPTLDWTTGWREFLGAQLGASTAG